MQSRGLEGVGGLRNGFWGSVMETGTSGFSVTISSDVIRDNRTYSLVTYSFSV